MDLENRVVVAGVGRKLGSGQNWGGNLEVQTSISQLNMSCEGHGDVIHHTGTILSDTIVYI